MKTSKKILSLMLSIIMILGTVVVGFNGFDGTNFAKKLSGLFANNAEAASSRSAATTVPDLKFVVPETIYLYPDGMSFNTATHTPFQYYVNNDINGNAKAGVADTFDSTGNIYYYYDSSTTATLTYRFVKEDLKTEYTDGNGSITLSTTTLTGSTTAAAATITAGMSPSLAGGNGTDQSGCYIEWCLSLTGKDTKAYAYTYVYKPYVVPVVATARINLLDDSKGGNTIWFSGMHSITNGALAPKSDDDAENKTNAYGYTSRISGFISTSNKAYINSTEYTTGSKVADRYQTYSNLCSSATGVNRYMSFYGSGNSSIALVSSADKSNVNDWTTTNWASTTSGTTTFDKLNVYGSSSSWTAAAYRYANLRVYSPNYAELSVDTSRYTNLNQIPNVAIGYYFSANNACDNNAAGWHVADATGLVDRSYNGYVQKKNAESDSTASALVGNYYIAGQFNGLKNKICDDNELPRYAGSYPRALWQTGTTTPVNGSETQGSTFTYSIHGCSVNYRDVWTGNNTYPSTNTYLDLKTTYYSKKNLRAAVNNATKAMARFGVSGIDTNGKITSKYFEANSNYKWDTLQTAYQSAVKALGKVDGTYTVDTNDPDTLATNLNNALNALCTKVTFAGNGGSMSGTTNQYVEIGTNQVVTIKPADMGMSIGTKTGYEPSGWALTNSATSGSDTVTIGYNNTVYVAWNPHTFQFSFGLDGGKVGNNGTVSNVTLTYKKTSNWKIEDRVPQKTGYTFTGYYDNDGEKVYDANGHAVACKYWEQVSGGDNYQWKYDGTNDSTYALKAHWTANTYTVTLDSKGGTGGTTSVTATYDSAMPTATMPTKTGYTFGGYYDGENGAGTKYYNAAGTSARTWNKDSNTTLYAQWTPIQYNIIYENSAAPDGKTPGTLPNPHSYNYESTATDNVKGMSATGYIFKGWKVKEASGNWDKDTHVDVGVSPKSHYGNITLVAKWAIDDGTLNIDPNGGISTGNILYMRDGLSSYSGTSNVAGSTFTMAYDTDSSIEIDGSINTDGAHMLDTGGTLLADLEYNNHYRLTFSSKYKNVRVYTFTKNYYHQLLNDSEPTYNSSTGKYDFTVDFCAGIPISGADNTWENVTDTSEFTGTYKFRVDLTKASSDGADPEISNMKLVELDSVDYSVLHQKGQTRNLGIPTREGYIFNGWFDAATGGTRQDTNGIITVSGDTQSLYAQWKGVPLDVTYDELFDYNKFVDAAQNGGLGEVTSIESFENGFKIVTPAGNKMTNTANANDGYKYKVPVKEGQEYLFKYSQKNETNDKNNCQFYITFYDQDGNTVTTDFVNGNDWDYCFSRDFCSFCMPSNYNDESWWADPKTPNKDAKDRIVYITRFSPDGETAYQTTPDWWCSTRSNPYDTVYFSLTNKDVNGSTTKYGTSETYLIVPKGAEYVVFDFGMQDGDGCTVDFKDVSFKRVQHYALDDTNKNINITDPVGAAKENPGYAFTGWKINNTGDIIVDPVNLSTYTDGVSLTSQWKELEYIVAYDSEETKIVDSIVVPANTTTANNEFNITGGKNYIIAYQQKNANGNVVMRGYFIDSKGDIITDDNFEYYYAYPYDETGTLTQGGIAGLKIGDISRSLEKSHAQLYYGAADSDCYSTSENYGGICYMTFTAPANAKKLVIFYTSETNTNADVRSLLVAPDGKYEIYNYTEKATLISDEKAGYAFDGWYSEPALTNKVGDAEDKYQNDAIDVLYSKWIAIAENDTFIMDFGTAATLDVLGNDGAGLTISGISMMSNGSFGTTTISNASSDYTVSISNDKLLFTPKKILSSTVEFYYKTSSTVDGKNSAKVTIIPANNVYYEEDSGFITYVDGNSSKWSTIGEKSTAVVAAKRAEEAGLYGYDDSARYGQNYSEYSSGAHRELTVTKENTADNWGAYAEFTFTGTGFDVYSVTSCNAGYFAVRIKKDGTPDKNNADYKYSYNAYTGYRYENNQWIADNTKDKAIYQAPIISKLGLEHGTYTVRIYPLYSAMNDIGSRGQYTFYLDAIRIYNPMGTNITDDTVNAAYNEAGENDAKYLSIRNAIIAAEKAKGAGKEGVPGVSFFSTDVSAKTMTFGDYVSIGSKEDVFLAHNQGVSFGIKYSNGKPANVAIGVRKLEADNKAATVNVIIGNTTKTITVNSTTDIFRNIVNSTELSSYADTTGTIPVTITNISDDSGVNISITKLKVTYASGSGHTVEPVKNPVSAPLRSMVGDGEATERTVELVFNPEHFRQAVERFFLEKPTIDVSEVNVEWEKTSVELGDPARLFITAPEKVTKVTVDGSEVSGYETLSDGSKKWTYVVQADETCEKEFNVVAYVSDGEGGFTGTDSIATGIVTFVKPVIDIKDAGIEFENDEIKLNETTTLNIETSTKVAAVYVGDTRYTDFDLKDGKRVFTVDITPEKTGKNDFVIKLESITGDITETITKSITVTDYVVDSKGVTVKWSAGTIKQYETATLTVKTGENIVKVEADGKAMKLVKTENGEKTWEITYTEDKPGTKEVNIKLTDENEMKSENIKSGKLTIRKLTFWERIVRFFKKLFGLI